MGMFITVEIDVQTCAGIKACGRCLSVCPVNIYTEDGKIAVVDTRNEDECTLCDLCVGVCEPGAIVIKKEYE